ncbi:Beta-carotene isomerase D27, chloroplastic [Ananas comosus]|uniref:Beta-carotene isomerase D27, chloroplastic n=1 Tax=Ananas comosus TaxID=4615 RepID=A0A199W1Q0_ANACO|nr:Beta-carotene isomerase D27, chloroplastic [Ananas comosus]
MELSCLPSSCFPVPGRRRGCHVVGSVRCAGIAEPSGVPAPMGQKTQYRDGFFEKAFMSLFARKMEKFSAGGGEGGKTSSGRGFWGWDYDGFVDVSRGVMVGRSRKQQQEVVREVLLSMLPPGAPAQFRKLFPPTRWAAEFNAALTVPFFHWLVGPSEVVEVEVNGVKQRSGVHIKKCRYLENSGCVDFEDMSCDMVYGQVPPPFEEDPVSNQPCYSEYCSVANPSAKICPKLVT